MENKIDYLKVSDDYAAVEALEAFEKILDEIEHRYPDEENPMTVGMVIAIGMIVGLRDMLGDDLFYRNMRDIPDTEEAAAALIKEISLKAGQKRIKLPINEYKEDSMKEAE